MSLGLGNNTQQLDAVVDVSLLDDLDSASISSKLIGLKKSDGSINEIYLRCRMNFANYPAQNQAPYLIDQGLPAINTLNESGALGNPITRIERPTDGSHWIAPDHGFG